MDLSVSVMLHPEAEHVSADGNCLTFKGDGYTSVDVFLSAGVAEAIIAALGPYVGKGDVA